jgi:hypothetical protein
VCRSRVALKMGVSFKLPFVAIIVAFATGCGNVVQIGIETPDAAPSDAMSVDVVHNDAGSSDDVGEGQDGSAGDAGQPPDGDMEDASPPPCPTVAPMAGSMCPIVGQECEYGTSASTACNRLATCTSEGWTYASPVPKCAMGICPKNYDEEDGGSCSTEGLVCSYPMLGTCNCASMLGVVVDSGSSLTWQCFPEQTGCPIPRPNIGSPCMATSATLLCDYGPCAGGVELRCADGQWEEVMMPCPG